MVRSARRQGSHHVDSRPVSDEPTSNTVAGQPSQDSHQVGLRETALNKLHTRTGTIATATRCSPAMMNRLSPPTPPTSRSAGSDVPGGQRGQAPHFAQKRPPSPLHRRNEATQLDHTSPSSERSKRRRRESLHGLSPGRFLKSSHGRGGMPGDGSLSNSRLRWTPASKSLVMADQTGGTSYDTTADDDAHTRDRIVLLPTQRARDLSRIRDTSATRSPVQTPEIADNRYRSASLDRPEHVQYSRSSPSARICGAQETAPLLPDSIPPPVSSPLARQLEEISQLMEQEWQDDTISAQLSPPEYGKVQQTADKANQPHSPYVPSTPTWPRPTDVLPSKFTNPRQPETNVGPDSEAEPESKQERAQQSYGIHLRRAGNLLDRRTNLVASPGLGQVSAQSRSPSGQCTPANDLLLSVSNGNSPLLERQQHADATKEQSHDQRQILQASSQRIDHERLPVPSTPHRFGILSDLVPTPSPRRRLETSPKKQSQGASRSPQPTPLRHLLDSHTKHLGRATSVPIPIQQHGLAGPQTPETPVRKSRRLSLTPSYSLSFAIDGQQQGRTNARMRSDTATIGNSARSVECPGDNETSAVQLSAAEVRGGFLTQNALSAVPSSFLPQRTVSPSKPSSIAPAYWPANLISRKDAGAQSSSQQSPRKGESVHKLSMCEVDNALSLPTQQREDGESLAYVTPSGATSSAQSVPITTSPRRSHEAHVEKVRQASKSPARLRSDSSMLLTSPFEASPLGTPVDLHTMSLRRVLDSHKERLEPDLPVSPSASRQEVFVALRAPTPMQHLRKVTEHDVTPHPYRLQIHVNHEDEQEGSGSYRDEQDDKQITSTLSKPKSSSSRKREYGRASAYERDLSAILAEEVEDDVEEDDELVKLTFEKEADRTSNTGQHMPSYRQAALGIFGQIGHELKTGPTSDKGDGALEEHGRDGWRHSSENEEQGGWHTSQRYDQDQSEDEKLQSNATHNDVIQSLGILARGDEESEEEEFSPASLSAGRMRDGADDRLMNLLLLKDEPVLQDGSHYIATSSVSHRIAGNQSIEHRSPSQSVLADSEHDADDSPYTAQIDDGGEGWMEELDSHHPTSSAHIEYDEADDGKQSLQEDWSSEGASSAAWQDERSASNVTEESADFEPGNNSRQLPLPEDRRKMHLPPSLVNGSVESEDGERDGSADLVGELTFEQQKYERSTTPTSSTPASDCNVYEGERAWAEPEAEEDFEGQVYEDGSGVSEGDDEHANFGQQALESRRSRYQKSTTGQQVHPDTLLEDFTASPHTAPDGMEPEYRSRQGQRARQSSSFHTENASTTLSNVMRHRVSMLASRPSMVEVSSMNREAAARAAAILKRHHKYVQYGTLEANVEDESWSHTVADDLTRDLTRVRQAQMTSTSATESNEQTSVNATVQRNAHLQRYGREVAPGTPTQTKLALLRRTPLVPGAFPGSAKQAWGPLSPSSSRLNSLHVAEMRNCHAPDYAPDLNCFVEDEWSCLDRLITAEMTACANEQRAANRISKGQALLLAAESLNEAAIVTTFLRMHGLAAQGEAVLADWSARHLVRRVRILVRNFQRQLGKRYPYLNMDDASSRSVADTQVERPSTPGAQEKPIDESGVVRTMERVPFKLVNESTPAAKVLPHAIPSQSPSHGSGPTSRQSLYPTLPEKVSFTTSSANGASDEQESEEAQLANQHDPAVGNVDRVTHLKAAVGGQPSTTSHLARRSLGMLSQFFGLVGGKERMDSAKVSSDSSLEGSEEESDELEMRNMSLRAARSSLAPHRPPTSRSQDVSQYTSQMAAGSSLRRGPAPSRSFVSSAHRSWTSKEQDASIQSYATGRVWKQPEIYSNTANTTHSASASRLTVSRTPARRINSGSSSYVQPTALSMLSPHTHAEAKTKAQAFRDSRSDRDWRSPRQVRGRAGNQSSSMTVSHAEGGRSIVRDDTRRTGPPDTVLLQERQQLSFTSGRFRNF